MTVTSEEVVDSLREVYDPCCEDRGISIVDMGVLEAVRINDNGSVEVDLVLTTGWCPFVTSMSDRIPEKLQADFGITDVQVNTLWNPVWTMDRLSEEARAKLAWDLTPLLPYREQRLAAEAAATPDLAPTPDLAQTPDLAPTLNLAQEGAA